MRKAIWRSRATAIVGFAIMALVVFSGLPGVLRSTLFFALGFLTLCFGLGGSRHKSYSEVMEEISPIPAKDRAPEMDLVEEGQPIAILEPEAIVEGNQPEETTINE